MCLWLVAAYISVGDVGHDCCKEKTCAISIQVHVSWLNAAVHDCVDEGPVHDASCEASDPLVAEALHARVDASFEARGWLESG